MILGHEELIKLIAPTKTGQITESVTPIFDVTIKSEVPLKELINQLHEVTLLHDKTVKPYKHTSITLENFHTDELKPISLYVLKNKLDLFKQLRAILISQYGTDILQLDRGLIYECSGKTYTMIPPIIEFSEIDDKAKIVLDGLHRAYIARDAGEKITAIYLRAETEIPIYAYPNRWSEITPYDKTPEFGLKKRYRSQNMEELYKLYRDFSTVGTGRPRERDKAE